MAGWRPHDDDLVDYDGPDDFDRDPLFRRFTYPFPAREELADRIAALGEDPESADDLARAKEAYDALAGLFPVWEENWHSIRGFLTVRTQWLRSGMGEATGLNYPAVEARIARYVRTEGLSQKQHDRVLDDIEIMESIVVSEWARDAKRRADELNRKRGKGAL